MIARDEVEGLFPIFGLSTKAESPKRMGPAQPHHLRANAAESGSPTDVFSSGELIWREEQSRYAIDDAWSKKFGR